MAYNVVNKKAKEKYNAYIGKSKWKMGIYDKEGNLVDFGVYDTKKEAEADFKNWDKPKGLITNFDVNKKKVYIIEQE